MSKKNLLILFLTAALLPWILFSESFHNHVKHLLSWTGSLFSTKDVVKLVTKTRTDQIKIEGGEFYFGQFDRKFGEQRYASFSFDYALPLSIVTVKDFSMSRYQITYADYDIYTKQNGKEFIDTTDPKQRELREDHVPVRLTWQEAQDYCQWLGKISGQKMDLPTEEQWEYAARNRGQFILYPTDTGIVEPGRNVPLQADKVRIKYSIHDYKLMPVGMFPPNPLGLYDLASNGEEWTRDVYQETGFFADKDKYKDDRVVRSHSIGFPGGAPTIWRSFTNKDDRNTARCVVEP